MALWVVAYQSHVTFVCGNLFSNSTTWKFIFEKTGFFEISEHKNPSKIISYTVTVPITSCMLMSSLFQEPFLTKFNQHSYICIPNCGIGKLIHVHASNNYTLITCRISRLWNKLPTVDLNQLQLNSIPNFANTSQCTSKLIIHVYSRLEPIMLWKLPTVLCFWAIPKNQAYYAQIYAHRIKLCPRAHCFIE